MPQRYNIFKLGLAVFICSFTFASGLSFAPPQDSLNTAKQYQNSALAAVEKMDYENAVVDFTTALRLASESNDSLTLAKLHYDVGNLYYRLQSYERANRETLNAITILKDKDEPLLLAKAYTLFGNIKTRKGEYREAEIALNKANEIYTSLNDYENISRVNVGFGFLELKRKNYKSAVNYFNNAIPRYEQYGLKYDLVFANLYKTEALLNLTDEDIPDRLQIARESMDAADEILAAENFPNLNIECYLISSQLAIQEGNSQDAIININRYEGLRDSLDNVFAKALTKGRDAELEIANFKQIIESQQSDIDKQKKSISLGKMTTGLSVALIVILSLLTVSLYKNNNLRAKANTLLQEKNAELVEAKDKAEKASLAKAKFLSTITHELRTPLYAVTGLTHLLLDEDPNPVQKEHLNSLKFSGEYLLSLINNILDLNKLEANKVELEKTNFNLKKRINDVLVALKKSADDHNDELVLEFDSNIPNKITGDPLKLSQVLINLVGNSVKFTKNGTVTVRVTELESTHDSTELRFEIEDTGIGISKKKQKSIFESFSQASLQINRKFGGTGLGLAIVKNLLELMDSKINLDSTLGKGSKFWFDISFEIPKEALNGSTSPKESTVDYAALEGVSVLLVEDNKINQMITKKILEKHKMECAVSDNGTDAIEMVRENEFDIVLMDIHMPGISGVVATQQIREFDRNIPIIALTAVTIEENLDDIYRAGFNEIIPKPFKTEEFFERIYSTLENKQIITH